MSTKNEHRTLAEIDADLEREIEITKTRLRQLEFRRTAVRLLRGDSDVDAIFPAPDGTTTAAQVKRPTVEVTRARNLPDLVYQVLLNQLPEGLTAVQLFNKLRDSGAPISRRPYTYALLHGLRDRGLVQQADNGIWFARPIDTVNREASEEARDAFTQ